MHNRRAQCGKKATREAAKTAASRTSTAAAVLMRPSPGVTKSSPAAQRSCRGHAWRAYTEEKRLALNTHHGRVSPKSRLRELLRERAGRQRRRRVAIFAQLDASAVERKRDALAKTDQKTNRRTDGPTTTPRYQPQLSIAARSLGAMRRMQLRDTDTVAEFLLVALVKN